MLPAYFISHGSPDIVLRNTPAAQFLKSIKLPEAKAILVVSAHWMTHEPMVTAHPHPSTIHDFGGFPKSLYELNYPALGDPTLAAKIVANLTPEFPLSALDSKRGLDHGAWMPLLMAEPEAKIPVLQLSIQPHLDAKHHYEIGKKLQDLRERGVIIMASGNTTHNLRAVFEQRYTETPPQVGSFNNWLYDEVTVRDDAELMRWEKAPDALWNHPTNDHIMPLFTVLGATQGNKNSERIHHSIDYQVLAMDAYRL